MVRASEEDHRKPRLEFVAQCFRHVQPRYRSMGILVHVDETDASVRRAKLVLYAALLPEMDGLEATMAIRALDREDAKDVPIIALTANAFDEDVQKSLQAGLNAHLSKPVEPDVLFETLEGLIRP